MATTIEMAPCLHLPYMESRELGAAMARIMQLHYCVFHFPLNNSVQLGNLYSKCVVSSMYEVYGLPAIEACCMYVLACIAQAHCKYKVQLYLNFGGIFELSICPPPLNLDGKQLILMTSGGELYD